MCHVKGMTFVDKDCPCCKSSLTSELTIVSGYKYSKCEDCNSLFIDNEILNRMDVGFSLIEYSNDYWKRELPSAKQRAYGPALARMAEAFYYSRVPINRFFDIATGPGYFLDAVERYLPYSSDVFYGIEKFPPPLEFRSTSKNYMTGDLREIDFKFDGGICIEVIEHITPKMLRELFHNLSQISNHGAFYIFNSGMPDYVLNEDMKYLDPVNRGHVVSYSLQAIKVLSKESGFTAFELPGKTWAFGLEYESDSDESENIQDRIWTALDHNLNILGDPEMGSVLQILGIDTSRAYK